MKWEQTFVAYSDCGKYKIEVDEAVCDAEGKPVDGWDWTIYELDSFDNEFMYLKECDEPFSSSRAACAAAVMNLYDVLAEDKQREEALAAKIADPNRGLFAINYEDVHGRPAPWRYSTNDSDWVNLGRRCGKTWLIQEPFKKLLLTGDASGFSSHNFFQGVPRHLCCGATSVEHMSDCPACCSCSGVEYCERCVGGYGPKDTTPNQGDFWAPPKDVREDEFSCPVLEENVQKELPIVPKFKSVRLCGDCGEPTENNSLCTLCEMEKDKQLTTAVERIKAIKPSKPVVLEEILPKSGYDQILASIKNESKDIEL